MNLQEGIQSVKDGIYHVTGTRTSDGKQFLCVLPVSASYGGAGLRIDYKTITTNAVVSVTTDANQSIYGLNVINSSTQMVYLKYFDKPHTEVVLGTDVPVRVFAIPPGDGSLNGIFFQEVINTPQAFFTKAISFAIVTGLANSSTTGPAAAVYCETTFGVI